MCSNPESKEAASTIATALYIWNPSGTHQKSMEMLQAIILTLQLISMN